MSEFDSVADDYDDLVAHAIGGQDHDAFTRRKADVLIDLSRRQLGSTSSLRVLDVGCGVGLTDQHLAGRFEELHGVDPSAAAIERASDLNPNVRYRVNTSSTLPYEDGVFDLAFAICVVHHVAPDAWNQFVAELARVVRPGGVVALLEHNPWNPLTRVVVGRCEFDADAVLLGRRRAARLLKDAGLDVVERRYIVFLPFERRWVPNLEKGIGWLPLGAQHCVAARRH
jgi:SAM-dependent methyltransferase